MIARVRARVRGQVQGVGYRPFVARVAARHALSGWVLNDVEGVLLEAEGAPEALDAFVLALAREAPPLARVTAVESAPLPAHDDHDGFAIRGSVHGGVLSAAIPPDAAPCDDCVRELFDPRGRRYLYPFTSCASCGPRHTITRALPYDRPQTSMAPFPMCPDCAREYGDPTDRRFHAQPIACPACGPELRLLVGGEARGHAALMVAAERLRAGGLVALKGVGGFLLACDARDAVAVETLRRRKQRDGKPFAVMVSDLAAARALADVGEAEAALLASPERPIVLCARSDGDGLAPGVAPDLASVGLMLPSSPLHHVLFHLVGREAALVMTSANPGGEPLLIDDDQATRRLASIADVIVGHDRPIVVRTDDSVVRVVARAPLFLRRARGYVPRPIPLGRTLPPILALGAREKATVCVVRGDEAFVSQHVGDLDDVATLRFFDETVAHLLSTLKVTPVAVAHDLHPDFSSSRRAVESGLPAFAIQHHAAHVASVLAEHRVRGRALGLALDGFGLGDDGGAWGGELIEVDLERGTTARHGGLAPLRLPGGDAAARQPWRMAAAALYALGVDGEAIVARFAAHGARPALVEMMARGIRSPLTSSCGRLFDAACGLLGIRPVATYEGEAPMILEGLVRRPSILAGGYRLADGGRTLDLLPTLAALARDDVDPRFGAELFHGTLAAGLIAWVEAARAALDLPPVVALSGGCLANRVLAELLVDGLALRGVRALLPRALPPNDGGLSLGQALLGGLQLMSSNQKGAS